MILGMRTSTYTAIHVVISLMGLVSGFVAAYGLLSRKFLGRWTSLFLTTTVLTSVTGYGFPADKILPSHVVGAISLVVLAIALFALYARHLVGPWRATYVITGVTALYLNVFVLIVQAFEKIPALKAAAPTQTEAPFAVAQLAVLAGFIVLTIAAVKRFRTEPIRLARAA